MNTQVLFASAGVIPVVIGLLHLLFPSWWAMPEEDDARRDPAGNPIAIPHWQVRLRGLLFLAFGLVWIYCVLFVKPSDDPVLI